MNNDLISRSELQIAHKEHCCGECACCVNYKEGFNCELIDNAPTVYDTINLYPNGAVIIQQTIPQGEWKTVEGYDGDEYYECSNCGEPWVLYAGTPETNNMNFCPNCGADMRKGGAE